MSHRISFIALLLLAAFAWAMTPGGGESLGVKVMTYNVRYDNPGDGDHSWSKRQAAVMERINAATPDVLGTQECLHHQLIALDAGLRNYKYVGVGRENGETKGEYAAIFYRADRFEVVESGTFWLSEKPHKPSVGWDASMERICTWAQLRDKSSQRELLVMNAHYDHMGVTARWESSKLVLTKAHELAKDLPLIFMGDLNTTEDEAPIRLLTGGGKLLDCAETVVTHSAVVPFTFPGNGFAARSETSSGFQNATRIDYIFHSPDWRNLSYQVDATSNNGFYPSDHLPVIAELETK